MTHEERFQKVHEALRSAFADGADDCGFVFILVSNSEENDESEFSILSNMEDEGKIHLMKDVIHSFEHDEMDRDPQFQ